MSPLKFRVFLNARSGDEIDVGSVVTWLREQSPDHLLVVQHDADNDDARPHYHALLFSDRPIQSLRVALLKAVPSVKANYSLQEMPHDAVPQYLRYMCHGAGRGDEVKIVFASLAKYTPAWAQAENRAFWDARKAFKQDQSKKTEDILSHCIEQAKTQGLRTYREVAGMVLDEYQARKKTFHVAHIRHQVLTIWHAVGGPAQKRDVIDFICGGTENFLPISTTLEWPTSGSARLDDPLDA